MAALSTTATLLLVGAAVALILGILMQYLPAWKGKVPKEAYLVAYGVALASGVGAVLVANAVDKAKSVSGASSGAASRRADEPQAVLFHGAAPSSSARKAAVTPTVDNYAAVIKNFLKNRATQQ